MEKTKAPKTKQGKIPFNQPKAPPNTKTPNAQVTKNYQTSTRSSAKRPTIADDDDIISPENENYGVESDCTPYDSADDNRPPPRKRHKR